LHLSYMDLTGISSSLTYIVNPKQNSRRYRMVA
jgi:hypothetical protein